MSPIPTVCLCLAALLSGCAAPVDVRSVGTGGAPPAYELRGPSLAALDLQARALCADGHQIIRQWQRLHRQAGDATRLGRLIGKAEENLGLVENDEAQMLVQCAPVTP